MDYLTVFENQVTMQGLSQDCKTNVTQLLLKACLGWVLFQFTWSCSNEKVIKTPTFGNVM